jgi:carboxylate-amine ligase
MTNARTARTLLVEEEFLLVDTATCRPAPVARRVLADCADGGCAVDPEPGLERVATATPPLRDLDALRDALVALRRRAAAAAEPHGAVLVASGTSPFPESAHTPDAAGPLTFGVQVRVGTESLDEAVAAVERMRPWLPVLVAMGANSPFWRGHDTDYASYRTQVPGRRPPVGLSHRYPAVEVRAADVPLEVDDAVLVAALARALVHTGARRWREGRPAALVRPEVARLAMWRASRSGLAAVLVDVTTRRPVPARVLVHKLVTHVQDALEEAGDREAVQELVADLLARGTGSARQRDAYRDRGRLDDVVQFLAERSVPLAPVGAAG